MVLGLVDVNGMGTMVRRHKNGLLRADGHEWDRHKGLLTQKPGVGCSSGRKRWALDWFMQKRGVRCLSIRTRGGQGLVHMETGCWYSSRQEGWVQGLVHAETGWQELVDTNEVGAGAHSHRNKVVGACRCE